MSALPWNRKAARSLIVRIGDINTIRWAQTRNISYVNGTYGRSSRGGRSKKTVSPAMAEKEKRLKDASMAVEDEVADIDAKLMADAELQDLNHAERMEIRSRIALLTNRTFSAPSYPLTYTAKSSRYKEKDITYPSMLIARSDLLPTMQNVDYKLMDARSLHTGRQSQTEFDPSQVVLSPSLVALKARLNLSENFPLTTLARALTCQSSPVAKIYVDNSELDQIGKSYLDYLITEFVMFTYVRLPIKIVKEAVWSYIGDDALADVGHNWGVERELPSQADQAAASKFPDAYGVLKYNRVVARRVNGLSEYAEVDGAGTTDGRTGYQRYSEAMSSFVRSVIAGIYIHEGELAARKFVHAHILSRKVDVSTLFKIEQPTRELSRLCEREKLQPPVSRMISETGRLSRSPVFVIGVYSGSNVLGSGEGSSIKEAETRAAINALKGWYLYSPPDIRLPSQVLAGRADTDAPIYVDHGEVIV